MAFESELAKISVPKEKLRDPQLTYNPMTIKEVCFLVPSRAVFVVVADACLGRFSMPGAFTLQNDKHAFVSCSQLQKSFGPTETFSWQAYFDALGLKQPVTKVIVTTPTFFSGVCVCFFVCLKRNDLRKTATAGSTVRWADRRRHTSPFHFHSCSDPPNSTLNRSSWQGSELYTPARPPALLLGHVHDVVRALPAQGVP